VLPHAMRFNAQATDGRLRLVAEALHASDAIAAVEGLFASLKVPKRLRDIRVPKDALPQLADDIAGDWFLHQNPRRVTGSAELLELLEAAW
jgi:alcohol dehydrogenase class IV